MRIIQYIPTIDQTWGGTSSYMQLLGNSLGNLVELHIITHISKEPLPIENCQLHNHNRVPAQTFLVLAE